MIRGRDNSQLYFEDTLERIWRMEREINERVRKMNALIKESKLLEELIPIPYPGAEDCE